MTSRKLRARPGRWLPRTFLLFLLIPAMVIIVQRDEDLPIPENIDELLTLPPELKHYFAAEFELRNRLAGLNHRSMRALNGDAGISRLAREGRDGWLFNFNYRRNHADFGIPAEVLRHSLEDVSSKSEFCAKLGIVYIPLNIPSKATVYHEFLPERMTRQMGTPGEVTEWHRYWVTKANGIRAVDLITPMRMRRQVAPVYFKTDSHWSEFGAYIAAEEVLGELRKTIPGLPVPYREELNFESFTCPPGNEARILGVEKLTAETYVRPVLPEARKVRLADGTSPEIHAINLTGAQGQVMHLKCQQGEMKSVIVFNNSFGVALIPYMSRYFRDTWFAWLGFSPELIQEHHPTVVVELHTRY